MEGCQYRSQVGPDGARPPPVVLSAPCRFSAPSAPGAQNLRGANLTNRQFDKLTYSLKKFTHISDFLLRIFVRMLHWYIINPFAPEIVLSVQGHANYSTGSSGIAPRKPRCSGIRAPCAPEKLNYSTKCVSWNRNISPSPHCIPQTEIWAMRPLRPGDSHGPFAPHRLT